MTTLPPRSDVPEYETWNAEIQRRVSRLYFYAAMSQAV